MSKEELRDKDLVEAIKEGGEIRQKALAHIYQISGLQDRILNFVKFKGGTASEAEEVWIESIVIMDRNIRANKFNEAASIPTYVFSIAKFYWLNLLRSKKSEITGIELQEKHIQIIDCANPELILINNELKEGLEKLITLLSEKCQIILKLWSNNAKYDEIAERLGVDKNGSLRKAKLTCIRKLKDHLLSNPDLIPNYYHGRT